MAAHPMAATAIAVATARACASAVTAATGAISLAAAPCSVATAPAFVFVLVLVVIVLIRLELIRWAAAVLGSGVGSRHGGDGHVRGGRGLACGRRRRVWGGRIGLGEGDAGHQQRKRRGTRGNSVHHRLRLRCPSC
jgi:hypothetical protein